jgi:two-component system phosphate regulon sensor histidine kinase PhoR
MSGTISFLATLVLFGLEHLAFDRLLFFFFCCFLFSVISAFIAMEHFIFRRIRKIKAKIDKLAGVVESEKLNTLTGDTVQGMSDSIDSFAAWSQEEIDRLKKLEASRKDLIADISHELKTPIFAAQGFIHTLIDGAVKEKAVRKKFLKKAAKSLDGLDMLVQDLLTLSEIETGQVKMRFKEFDLYALSAEVFDQIKHKADKKEIALRIEGPLRRVPVYADRQRIAQVLTNLISNAIKHSFEKGEVVVSFTEKKKSVVTSVRDFGEGIPKQDIGRIFERFYRVDKSRSREKGGTGLGLAIVKHILERHHSKPKVQSVPGEGSTFSFKLRKVRNENSHNGRNDESTKD